MSLLTSVPVGSKTRSVALCPSSIPNEFLLATGSWDEAGRQNRVCTFSLRFDQSVMDSAVSLDQSRFLVQRTGMLDGFTDVIALKYLSDGSLAYGTADGLLGVMREGVRDFTWYAHSRGTTCRAMALQGEDELAAVFEDGTVIIGRASPSSAQHTVRLPSYLEPLDICWLGAHETCVSTANSRLLLLDTRASKATDTLIINSRAEAGKQLRIRALDHDPASSPDWLLCTGDDEASVRLWDRRNLSQVLAESLPTARRAITSIRMHRAIPNTILSGSVDGSVVQHQIEEGGALMEETWEMPSGAVPVAVNAVEMLGSLAVAALDNATVLAWRA